jgi:hypothetical protein
MPLMNRFVYNSGDMPGGVGALQLQPACIQGMRCGCVVCWLIHSKHSTCMRLIQACQLCRSGSVYSAIVTLSLGNKGGMSSLPLQYSACEDAQPCAV